MSLQDFVQACLDDDAAHDRAIEELSLAREAQGYQLVGGGQTGGHDDGPPWEVTDHRTGEIIAAGVGVDSFNALLDSEATQMWFHIDNLDRHFELLSELPSSGFPTGLAESIREWVECNLDEARRFISETT